MQPRIVDALAFDGIDNHHAKHQCAQRIHGLVALQKALGQGLVDIVARGGAEQAGRQEKAAPPTMAKAKISTGVMILPMLSISLPG